MPALIEDVPQSRDISLAIRCRVNVVEAAIDGRRKRPVPRRVGRRVLDQELHLDSLLRGPQLGEFDGLFDEIDTGHLETASGEVHRGPTCAATGIEQRPGDPVCQGDEGRLGRPISQGGVASV